MTTGAFTLAFFTYPGLAAAGAGLMSVPIIIHLLNRRRFRRVIWAAMDWLLAAQRKNARRIRVEQLILLAVRCLIMLLIAFAVARPILGAMGLGGVFGQSRTLRVLVLDDSYSMNCGSGGALTPLGHARNAANRLLDLFESDDPVAVVLAGAPARALIEQPSYDHRAVREAIGEVRPTARGTDLGGALKLVRSILDKEGTPFARQVIILGDRTRSAWMPAEALETAADKFGGPGGGDESSSADSQAPLASMLAVIGQSASVTFVDAGFQEASNLAVTDLSARHEVVGTDQQLRLAATVRNFGLLERRRLQVRLTIESPRQGVLLQRELNIDPVAPGKAVQAEQFFQLADAGFYAITATLTDADSSGLAEDLLADDDERFLAMELEPRVKVLLVDGEPGRRAAEGEVFALMLAMTPLVKSEGREKLEELEGYPLEPRLVKSLQAAPGWKPDAKLVVLANVDLLSTPGAAEIAKALTEFVHAGGGLIIFPGTQTYTPNCLEAYNRLFYQEGAGLLPGRLAQPAQPDRPIDRSGGQTLLINDFSHPILAEFRAKKEPFQSARFFRHVKIELAGDSPASVLARYVGDGDPAIVLKEFGRGRVALLASSADGDWNNFFSKPDFMPFVNKLAYFLAPPSDFSRNLLVGQSLAEPLTADQAKELALLTVPTNRHGGSGAKEQVRQIQPRPRDVDEADGRRYLAQAADLSVPGLYTLKAGGTSLVYAVNPPARSEGDLSMLDRRAIAEIVGAKAKIVSADQVDEFRQRISGGTEMSQTLLYVVLALCLLETLLAQRFGHFRE